MKNLEKKLSMIQKLVGNVVDSLLLVQSIHMMIYNLLLLQILHLSLVHQLQNVPRLWIFDIGLRWQIKNIVMVLISKIIVNYYSTLSLSSTHSHHSFNSFILHSHHPLTRQTNQDAYWNTHYQGDQNFFYVSSFFSFASVHILIPIDIKISYLLHDTKLNT